MGERWLETRTGEGGEIVPPMPLHLACLEQVSSRSFMHRDQTNVVINAGETAYVEVGIGSLERTLNYDIR